MYDQLEILKEIINNLSTSELKVAADKAGIDFDIVLSFLD